MPQVRILQMRFKLTALSFLVATLAACGPSGGQQHGFPPAQVSVITIEPKTLPATFEYTGQTLGSREVEVRARVTGILQKRNFVEGGPVKAGQSLVSGPDVLLTSVIQIDPIWVGFGISDNDQLKLNAERDAGRLLPPKDGQFEVTVKLADGTTISQPGKLNFSDVRVSGATGTSE